MQAFTTVATSLEKLYNGGEMKVAIIDYGLGNLMSVKKAFEHFNIEVLITKEEKVIKECDAIVLPGVGAFSDAVKNISPLKDVVISESEEKPILGICLGLQLLFTLSEEDGLHRGLNLIKGIVKRLPEGIKVPHMGWNSITIEKQNEIVDGIKSGDYFYFVHSYYAEPEESVVVASCEYGVKFPAIIADRNIYATQFHPEKSGKKGLKIIENFIKIARK